MKSRTTTALALVAAAVAMLACGTEAGTGCTPSRAEFTEAARIIVEGVGGSRPTVDTTERWAITITDVINDEDGRNLAIAAVTVDLPNHGITDETVVRRTAARVVGAAETELCLT